MSRSQAKRIEELRAMRACDVKAFVDALVLVAPPSEIDVATGSRVVVAHHSGEDLSARVISVRSGECVVTFDDSDGWRRQGLPSSKRKNVVVNRKDVRPWVAPPMARRASELLGEAL